jgi:hypothetical protein
LKRAVWLGLVLLVAASPALAQGPQAMRADGASDNATILRRFSHISCEMVRAFVSEVGMEHARAMALAAGMTPAQERRAARCLDQKI